MPLPFEIKATLADVRGNVRFTVRMDGEDVAMATYRLGDSKRRLATARQWSKREELDCGDAAAIAYALERKEISAQAQIDQIQADVDASSPDDTIRAAGYVDGNIIAELALNVGGGRVNTDFLVWDRSQGTVSRMESVDTERGKLVAPKSATLPGIVTVGNGMEGSVFLPSECDDAPVDEITLRRDIRAFIDRYVELPDDSVEAAVEYVLLSWVYDAFDELPYLAFRTADAGRGKSRALESVGALCYRPIFCGGGSTAAAVLRLLHIFGGTLLADEFDQRDTELAAEITKILNQGFQRNRPIVRCTGDANEPTPFRCFGPKLFVLRKGFADDATETRTISIQMRQRTRRDIPINLPRVRFDVEALALRNRLLSWRFQNLGRVRLKPELADPRLEDRANQIGTPLLSIAADPSVRWKIVVALMRQQVDVASERSETLAGEVFLAALAVGEVGGVVRPGEITAEVNRLRAAAEGIEPDKLRNGVDVRKVGRILRHDLELPPGKRDGQGAKYILEDARVRQLCARFGQAFVGTTQTSKRHSSHETSSENPHSGDENDDRDVRDFNDVSGGLARAATTRTPRTSADAPHIGGGLDL